MERRKFIEICALGAASGCAGDACAQAAASSERIKAPGQTPPAPKRSGVMLKPQPYTRVKLVDVDGRAIVAKSLRPNHNYVFHYPFESTPCFLLNLDRALTQSIELLTETGDIYQWQGGVGARKNIVAFSAICAHKLAYPSPQISFISYRNKPSPIHASGNIIGCCADKSVYDPAQGAKVLSGPAPQPLAGILLEHDAKTDQLFAVGTIGGEMFDAFFNKYDFKLSLEKKRRSCKKIESQVLLCYATSPRTRNKLPSVDVIPWITRGARFPSPNTALVEPDGLLCAGGDLAPDTILRAYAQGIYPWFSHGQPILWWTPDPRMVLFPDELKISKSLAKTIRQQKFDVRFDTAFAEVVRGCAAPREAGGTIGGGTWIVEDIQNAYCALHRQGHAHSAEAWSNGQLVGGLYGIAIGRTFYGESMFTLESDASKVAFVAMMQKLKLDGFGLIDCQQQTQHLARFGARPIARVTFMQHLSELINSSSITTSSWSPA